MREVGPSISWRCARRTRHTPGTNWSQPPTSWEPQDWPGQRACPRAEPPGKLAGGMCRPGPCQQVLTDEVGGVGDPEKVWQVQPLDEGGIHGDGLAPAPRVVCRWRACIRVPDVPSLPVCCPVACRGPVSTGSYAHSPTFTQPQNTPSRTGAPRGHQPRGSGTL